MRVSIKTTACLLLGSNVGRRTVYLAKARRAIARWPHVKILGHSPVLETAPEKFTRQKKFLNQALRIKTDLRPLALLLWAKKTEIELGRKKRFRFGPRELDIDIIRYGTLRLQTRLLTIPHPRLASSASMKSCVEMLP